MGGFQSQRLGLVMEPVLTPVLPQERQGTIDKVVFPTGIDRCDDLGSPTRRK